MKFQDVSKDLIRVTEYKVNGKLPNPFIMDNGDIVKNANVWKERRKEIYKSAIDLQYGTQPPKPEFLEVETLYSGGYGGKNSYRIKTGTRKKPIQFMMQVFLPKEKGIYPTAVDGDLCFGYFFNKEYIDTFRNNNVIFAVFDRTELANDIKGEGRGKGQLYNTYPEYSFGAIGAWSWGYSRCVDALEKIGFSDMNCIVFTGHSRGGKTAMLAGALDERAAIVNPNSTCAGACSCYRIEMKAITEDGEEARSERLTDLIKNFGFWMGEGMVDYIGKENDLPFDSHYLKAMIAPRILFVSESGSDIWANPIGSWMTTQAAKEVYKFLGKEENLYWYFRKGYHYHKVEDLIQLMNIINHYKYNEPINDRFFKTPFKEPKFIFDWHCPK